MDLANTNSYQVHCALCNKNLTGYTCLYDSLNGLRFCNEACHGAYQYDKETNMDKIVELCPTCAQPVTIQPTEDGSVFVPVDAVAAVNRWCDAVEQVNQAYGYNLDDSKRVSAIVAAETALSVATKGLWESVGREKV